MENDISEEEKRAMEEQEARELEEFEREKLRIEKEMAELKEQLRAAM